MKIKNIKIEKACNENWEKMNPNEQGRFCQSCTKTVIDFTQLSQKEIIEQIKSAKGGICGRFTEIQLKTPFVDFDNYEKPFHFPYTKVAAGFLLAASVFATSPISAKNDVQPHQNCMVQLLLNSAEKENQKKENASQLQEVTDSIIVFNGKVLSPISDLPVQNATVSIITINKIYNAITCSDGSFSFSIPSKELDNDNVIRFSFDDKARIKIEDEEPSVVHYNTEDIVLSKDKMTNEYIFEASDNCTAVIMGIVAWDVHVDDANECKTVEIENKNAIIIYNGKEVSYKEFLNIEKGELTQFGRLIPKKEYYFEGSAAIALAGEEAKNGLYLFFDEISH